MAIFSSWCAQTRYQQWLYGGCHHLPSLTSQYQIRKYLRKDMGTAEKSYTIEIWIPWKTVNISITKARYPKAFITWNWDYIIPWADVVLANNNCLSCNEGIIYTALIRHNTLKSSIFSVKDNVNEINVYRPIQCTTQQYINISTNGLVISTSMFLAVLY